MRRKREVSDTYTTVSKLTEIVTKNNVKVDTIEF